MVVIRVGLLPWEKIHAPDQDLSLCSGKGKGMCERDSQKPRDSFCVCVETNDILVLQKYYHTLDHYDHQLCELEQAFQPHDNLDALPQVEIDCCY